jgi:hypothetical protein
VAVDGPRHKGVPGRRLTSAVLRTALVAAGCSIVTVHLGHQMGIPRQKREMGEVTRETLWVRVKPRAGMTKDSRSQLKTSTNTTHVIWALINT